MNKKIFYLSIFLIFVLFLSGCSYNSIGTTDTELERVKNVINGFWSAIDEENWTYACAYCHGDAVDGFVEPYINTLQVLKTICPEVIVDVYAYVSSDISFIDAYTAEAEVQINTIVSGCGYSKTTTQFGTMELRYYHYSVVDKWLVHSIDLK